jgi:2-amino-4-hydroxy-6-hydroxymethyldihydropteridine diphosphokinase
MPDVYVGVGSNIEPESNILSAVEALRDEFGTINSSSVYRNPPIGFEGDEFLNLVLRFQSETNPRVVEQLLGDLELHAGRDRSQARPGPRSLDLDLLLFGSVVDASLRLPHEDILGGTRTGVEASNHRDRY